MAAAVSANSEIGRVIRQSQGGVVTEPENVEALAGAIQEFFQEPAKRSAMGECGRQYAIRYWDETRVLSSFEAHLLKRGGTLAHGEVAESPISI